MGTDITSHFIYPFVWIICILKALSLASNVCSFVEIIKNYLGPRGEIWTLVIGDGKKIQ
jgi:hypothetical protein